MLPKKPIQIVTATALLLAACSYSAMGDETRYKLGLVVGDQQDRRLDSQILTAATDAFFSAKRFTLVERRKLNAVFTEQDLQNFLGHGDADLSKILGLDFLAIVDYTRERVNPDRYLETWEENPTHFLEVFYITVRLVRVQTGEVFATIKSLIDSLVAPSTPRVAGKHLLRAIRAAFPPMGYVINVTGENYIVDLGAEVGIQKGDKLEILREGAQMIGMNGEAMAPIQLKIGTLKVTDIRPDHAVCKVKSSDEPVVRGDLVRFSPKKSTWKNPLKVILPKIKYWRKKKGH